MQPYLSGYTLPEMSTWPDNYDHSSQGSWSEPLHYINLPLNATRFLWEYCEKEYTLVGCVATAIQNYSLILEDEYVNDTPTKCDPSSSVEPCPISYITHYIGDIHQPLHVSYEVDAGGNHADVQFFGSCTNLHSLWDSGLIKHYESLTSSNWQSLADTLTDYIADHINKAQSWGNVTDPSDWANESFQRLRLEPYNFQPGSSSPRSSWVTRSSSSCGWQLADGYYERNIPYVFDQLMKAGVRLATRLNSIFDPSFTTSDLIPYEH